jgi:hypothetical protein
VLQESLAYLATHHADLVERLLPGQVEMTHIDDTHVEIAYTIGAGGRPTPGSARTQVVHVPFYPRLQGYGEVHRRLADMCATSRRVVTTRKVSIPPLCYSLLSV